MMLAKLSPLALAPSRLSIGGAKPMPHIEIYTTRTCPYCHMARALLQRRKLTFAEIDVTGDQERRAWLREATGRHTVPQIFIGGTAIGGFDDLSELEASGKLDEMLAGS
jgi:glutaredoxin 3